MTTTLTHILPSGIQTNVGRYDPTRTLALQNLWAREFRKRFVDLEDSIRKAIVEEDCFGLVPELKIHATPKKKRTTTPGPRAFTFARSQDKLAEFEKWLQRQIDKGLLETTELTQVGRGVEGAWTNRYIADSYKRGVIRARYEMQKAGYKIPSIEASGGIQMVMGTPFHLDRIGLLFTRVFSDLKGITAAMDTQISRVLAQGLVDGDNPRLLARKLLAAINGTGMGDLGITDTLGRFIPARTRAELLARTEIIRAHHMATVQEYRNWAVAGVVVQAEWRTAGDDRVCPDCEELQKKVFTLDEIEGMIPRHPRCRCITIPVVVE